MLPILKCFLLVNALTFNSALKFSNPLMPNTFTTYPSVVEVDGLYYAISDNEYTGLKRLPIHVSANLQNWDLASYIFDENSWPAWTTDTILNYPEIIQFSEDYFLLYFRALDNKTGLYEIGAAFSKNILGPYYAFSHPIQEVRTVTHHIYNDNSSKYMFWSSTSWILGVSLNDDGLSLKNDEVHYLIDTSQEWQIDSVYSPFVLKRKKYYYMFFSGYSCSNTGAIGVARSTHPLGPYEKYSNNPILSSYDDWVGIFGPSVVLDTDHLSHVLLYEAQIANTFNCSKSLLCAQRITWNRSDWPHIKL